MASRLPRLLRPWSMLNPFTRTALATFAWNHRHEIGRWGRSLWDQMVTEANVSPAQAVRTGRVLFAVATDDQLRNARELRRITMSDGVVDVDVTPGWSRLPRLVDRIREVPGVRDVTVNGAPLTVVATTPATATG